MAKLISEKSKTFELPKKRKITIERRTYNMGKRKEIFWIEYNSKTGDVYKLPAFTIEELEEIIEQAKTLRD
ncbi:hypothetical protein [Chryseobacterium mucoviscidosis]|uniref:hypothetical protein n=1 Tax=Chryseobacterium mucoviscidosis TaxID=1945581 RepID=UPI0030189D3F